LRLGFFFSSRRRHTRFSRDWSSDVCSSDLGFYGIPLANWLPYSISRTWHIQIAIFWIATSWLATGLYYAPAISGVEPKYQRLGRSEERRVGKERRWRW